MMIERRQAVGEPGWAQACRQVHDQSVQIGFPFRADGLYWEAVAAAEAAADESPTERALVDALWGACSAMVFAPGLGPSVIRVLTGPWGRPLEPA